MLRLLHTADWQMGMMAQGLGPAAARVRAARLESLRNVLDAAADRAAHAVLVAGDLFENNQVDQSLVEQVAGILNDHARVPVHIIPGNHDPYTRDSIYRRPVWSQLREHVVVHITPTPVRIAPDALLLPCPLDRKTGVDDPTAAIAPRDNAADIRVGLAHGTMRIRPDVGDEYFPIPADAPSRRGLDYLALGHWHSTLAPLAGADAGAAAPFARAGYCGTHETTSFGERDSGNALLITLAGPGAPPAVEVIRTGVLQWRDVDIDLDALSLEAASRSLRDISDPQHTLLRIALRGGLTPQTLAELQPLRDLVRQRFLHAAIDESGLRPADAGDEILTTPHLLQTAQALRAWASGSPVEGFTLPADPRVARRALQMLHQAAWSARP